MNQAPLLVLHVLATVIWVGGMFFAHLVLRPVAMAQLDAPARLTLWSGVFKRFFPWVWVAVILLPLTGFLLLFGAFGSMADAPPDVHVMSGLGLVMVAIFIGLWSIPYRRFRAAVAAQHWKAAAHQLTLIRRLVATNLTLGLTTVVVATGGSYFF
jgi:uncharacterized membrane protein